MRREQLADDARIDAAAAELRAMNHMNQRFRVTQRSDGSIERRRAVGAVATARRIARQRPALARTDDPRQCIATVAAQVGAAGARLIAQNALAGQQRPQASIDRAAEGTQHCDVITRYASKVQCEPAHTRVRHDPVRRAASSKLLSISSRTLIRSWP